MCNGFFRILRLTLCKIHISCSRRVPLYERSLLPVSGLLLSSLHVYACIIKYVLNSLLHPSSKALQTIAHCYQCWQERVTGIHNALANNIIPVVNVFNVSVTTMFIYY